MAQVVYGGSREFKMLVSGEQHPNTVQYLRNQVASLGEYVGNIGGAATAWAQRAFDSFERFSSDNAMRYAQAALRKVTTHFQTDRITEYDTLAQIQHASLRMQRFIMASPVVREAYHTGRVEGYQGSYVDMWPTDIGQGHYDYNLVMDGVIVDIPGTKEDPEPTWMFQHYPEDLFEGDRQLNVVEKDAILSTWERVEHLMGSGLDDPTSPTGGML